MFKIDNQYFFILVVGVDVLQRDGGKLRGKLRSHPDRQGHTTFQLRVCCRAIFILVVLVPCLNSIYC